MAWGHLGNWPHLTQSRDHGMKKETRLTFLGKESTSGRTACIGPSPWTSQHMPPDAKLGLALEPPLFGFLFFPLEWNAYSVPL
jgi:hypothetical protein